MNSSPPTPRDSGPRMSYQPGGPQKSFDKQFLRDYLLSIRWDKNPPAPQLPEEIVRKDTRKISGGLREARGETSHLALTRRDCAL